MWCRSRSTTGRARAGRSKYGIGNRMFTAFADLLAVRWMKKRHLDYEVVTP